MTTNPSFYAQVPQIIVKPGEVLTVYLRVSESPLIQYQVELRVRENDPGKLPIAEIFTNGEDMCLRPYLNFNVWEPMP